MELLSDSESEGCSAGLCSLNLMESHANYILAGSVHDPITWIPSGTIWEDPEITSMIYSGHKSFRITKGSQGDNCAAPGVSSRYTIGLASTLDPSSFHS